MESSVRVGGKRAWNGDGQAGSGTWSSESRIKGQRKRKVMDAKGLGNKHGSRGSRDRSSSMVLHGV